MRCGIAEALPAKWPATWDTYQTDTDLILEHVQLLVQFENVAHELIDLMSPTARQEGGYLAK
jgi:hypothetical protein